MEQIIIYHNGECSKSKGALEILQEKNIPHTVRWYLAEPLSPQELRELLAKLSMKASDVIRRNEPLFRERFEGRNLSEEEWLDILYENPVLLERPVVEKGNKAIIARPPERLSEIL